MRRDRVTAAFPSWLTAERVQVALYAVACAYFCTLGLAAWKRAWLLRGGGEYLATDFLAFWAAGRLAADGQAAAAYDWVRHHAMAAVGVGAHDQRFPWLYPPSFLVFVTPFALLSYPIALLSWIAATMFGYVRVIRAIVPRTVSVFAAVAFPAVLINMATGQAGLLTATLIGGALVLLPTRPAAAGVLIGILTIKPQLGILFPLVLAISGLWTAVATATAVAFVLAGASMLLFGIGAWEAFVESLSGTSRAILSQGEMGFAKMQSVYGVLRAQGWGETSAGIVQAQIGIVLAVTLCAVWRRRMEYELKAAAFCVCALLVQPYVFIYDSAVLGVALAFLVALALRTGFLRFEVFGILLASLTLLLAFANGPHLGLCAALMVGLLVLRRAVGPGAVAETPAPVTVDLLDASAFAAHNHDLSSASLEDRVESRRERDKPWLFRTYAGHSTAAESNALYRANLAKGQTGLSVAFDLPTQTGYDPDHDLARGEIGKVGVSIAHLGDMRTLFADIPLAAMNTSMTINAPAAWLLALYVAVAEEQGADPARLQGTTQNDIIKEYLSRGTYVFPPAPSMRLIKDVILFTTREMPKWNPINVCSYHLQEAGATPIQELAFALATACAVLDTVRASGEVDEAGFADAFARISFFVNAGLRFVTEIAKMRAFAELWDEIARERYGIGDPKKRMFRYGVQVNSLGLTEQQPENNVHRILIEMLAVTLSKRARARAVQLPAWNEALGLPRSWDQQWSLRMQQVLAYETDLLEHEDLFDGSRVMDAKVGALKEAARAELARIDAAGGAIVAVEDGSLKRALVESNARRLARVETGEQVVVGVNRFQEGEPSPLVAGEGTFLSVPETVEMEAVAKLRAWRAGRDNRAVEAARADLERAAREGANIVAPSIAAAKAGMTTGEWGETLREVFGQYRAPTGVSVDTVGAPSGSDIRLVVADLATTLGGRPRLVVGKPGLDGHSNGAEQIALRARDVGMDVTYDGIRQTPAEIVARAIETDAHLIGLSILSGSHVPLVREVKARLRLEGRDHIPLVVGGIISAEDENVLRNMGVAAIYTPKDYVLDTIMADMVRVIGRGLERQAESPPSAPPRATTGRFAARAAR